jgi:hypothetical protein
LGQKENTQKKINIEKFKLESPIQKKKKKKRKEKKKEKRKKEKGKKDSILYFLSIRGW